MAHRSGRAALRQHQEAVADIMWTVSLPLWEFVVRAAIIYFALMLLLRLSGKRTLGEFTSFDMVVVLLIGESTQGALTAGDQSVIGALVVCATLIGLNVLIAFLGTRFRSLDRLVQGEPVVLLRNGQVFEKVLRRNNLPRSDLEEALRESGVEDPSGAALAILEVDGEISVIKADDKD